MKLDKWMEDHRADFDSQEAPEGIWKELQHAVPQKPSRPSLWPYAAAALVILATTVWYYQPETIPAKDLPTKDLPAGFLAQEVEYQTDLKLMEARIDLESLASNPDYEWVFEELNELENINQQYRGDLNQAVPQEELLEVLMDNYEKRLRLLRRLQMEIERNQKHDQNENFSI